MPQDRVYLSVASNIEPEANIYAAMEKLSKSCSVLDVSRCFVTDAIPAPGAEPTKDLPYFINCVVLIETDIDAKSLKFDVLRSLEAKLGRVRTADKYAPRPMDLDILLFNDDVIQGEKIEIPDPDIVKRWFLAQGILDINPEIKLPVSEELLAAIAKPALDKFFASDSDFSEDTELREKIRAIA